MFKTKCSYIYKIISAVAIAVLFTLTVFAGIINAADSNGTNVIMSSLSLTNIAESKTLSSLANEQNARVKIEVIRNDNKTTIAVPVKVIVALYDDKLQLKDVKTLQQYMLNSTEKITPNVFVDNNLGRAFITGSTKAGANQLVSLKVVKNSTGMVDYYEQAVTDAKGDYSFQYNINKSASDQYTVTVGGYWNSNSQSTIFSYPSTEKATINSLLMNADFDLSKYTNVNDGWKIKVYMWDSFDSLTPVSQTAKLPTPAGMGTPQDQNIKFIGRWDNGTTAKKGYWGGNYFKVGFTGTTAKLKLAAGAKLFYSIDGGPDTYLLGLGDVNDLTPVPLSNGNHILRVATQYQDQTFNFQSLILDPGATTFAPPVGNIIEFVGDSITAGYRLDTNLKTSGGGNALKTYAWLAAEALNCEHLQVACTGIPLLDGFSAYTGSNTGMGTQFFRLTSTLSTPTDSNAVLWDFAKYQPKIVVINLGTNDAGLGADPNVFEPAYVSFLQKIRTKYPDAYILALRTFRGSMETQTKNAVNTVKAAGDSKVLYVDTTNWIDANADTLDLIHPSWDGNVKLADKLKQFITDNNLLTN